MRIGLPALKRAASTAAPGASPSGGWSRSAPRQVAVLGSNEVFALYHAARIRPSGEMFQSDIVGEGPEQGNPTAEEHRNTRDDQPLNQACFQKALNRQPAIHVEMN